MHRRQVLARARMNRRSFLGLVAAAAASAGVTVTPAAASADSGAQTETAASGYRFDVVRVLVRLAVAARHTHPVLVPGRGGADAVQMGQITAGSTEGSFLAPRSYLAADGTLTVLFTGDPSDPLTGWVYMLAEPTTPAQFPTDPTSLRARSLAYASLSRLDGSRTLSLSTTSHTVTATTDSATGSQTGLSLDDEVLAGTTARTLITGALTVQSVNQSQAQTTIAWTHNNTNPLQLTIDSAGDRLRYTYTYTVLSAIDAAVPVTTAFTLPGGFATFESLRWRTFDRVNSNKPPMFQAETDPGGEPKSMSQYPFLMGRGPTGAYVGVIDHKSTALFGRIDEAARTFNIEQWLWPRTVGQTYTWTFEVTAGYEQYTNAFLRAYQPHTAGNTSDLTGGMFTTGSSFLTAGDAKSLYDLGTRVVFRHKWFFRNGAYFDPEQPFDQTYPNIELVPTTYAEVKQEVEVLQAAGLKTYLYVQFAGVSEDIASRFDSSLVRTPDGTTIRAGQDGGGGGRTPIANLYANPDPSGLYGSELLTQIDQILTAFKPDGIAMDRGDRFDFTYNTAYDYGAFNGYASPSVPDQAPLPESPTPLPASSVTRGGVEFYEQLDRILAKHGAQLFTNLPLSPAAMADSNLTMADPSSTPWTTFFMRASTNGKPFSILDRTPVSTASDFCAANKLVAQLGRAHPSLDLTCDEPLTDLHNDPRLQYIIPTDDAYPTYWLFADGASVVRFDETQTTVLDRYAGSEFIPLE